MDLLWNSGGETWDLLGRMLALTMFYAALAWLPVRFAGVLLRRVAVNRRPQRRPRPTSTVHVIR